MKNPGLWRIEQRQSVAEHVQALTAAGVAEPLARIASARGVTCFEQLTPKLSNLIPPEQLAGTFELAEALIALKASGGGLTVVGDYDADGATSTALAVKVLRRLGLKVDFLVPNRFEHGYGLVPVIAEQVAQRGSVALMTVDNGIAAFAGIRRAKELGLKVFVTDHHLAADELPEADVIVNPNLPGSHFGSKALAGVGVVFYVLMALRQRLVQLQQPEAKELNLSHFLDLVALGTVADVARLDDVNNRILVAAGLNRIRSGTMQAGIAALFEVSKSQAAFATSRDLGFRLGPRLNAAGRLSDMAIGVNCLVCDDMGEALALAEQLHDLNLSRRDIEHTMQEQALASLPVDQVGLGKTVVLFDQQWHVGVVGVLASRLKDRLGRPCFVFAKATEEGVIKGSGRSVPHLNLRDALDWMAKRHPELLISFGGHAAAAGASLEERHLALFKQSFEQAVSTLLPQLSSESVLYSDGPLEGQWLNYDFAEQLETFPWGNGFDEPVFDDCFEVLTQWVVADKHKKLVLRKDKKNYQGLIWHCLDTLPSHIRLAYRLEKNNWQGKREVQLLGECWQEQR